ncbi:MAG: hypothetical protein ABI821_11485 [Pseudomonadota bacterium]
MRVVLFVLAALFAVGAFFTFAGATTMPQQIFGAILLVVFAVFLVGAGIVDAIVQLKKTIAPLS